MKILKNGLFRLLSKNLHPFLINRYLHELCVPDRLQELHRQQGSCTRRMVDPLSVAQLRIQELQSLLREKDQECVEVRQERYKKLQEDMFRSRLEAVALVRRDRSPYMDVWSCDELAGWFEEIGLRDCCSFIFTQGIDGMFLLNLVMDSKDGGESDEDDDSSWGHMLRTMGLSFGSSVQNQDRLLYVLRASLVPFLARNAYRKGCLQRGDFLGAVQGTKEQELDARYMREELGIERVPTMSIFPDISSSGAASTKAIATYLACDELVQVVDQPLQREVVGYAVFFLPTPSEDSCGNEGFAQTPHTSHRHQKQQQHLYSWKVFSRLRLPVSASSPTSSFVQTAVVPSGNSDMEDEDVYVDEGEGWALLHNVDNWSFSDRHGGAYFRLSFPIAPPSAGESACAYNQFKIIFSSDDKNRTNYHIHHNTVSNNKAFHIYTSCIL